MSSAYAGNADLNRVSLSVDASSLANAPRGNAPRRARQVAVPAVARARCTLRHVDYEDAFAVELRSAHVRTAEQWARAILEDAPLAMRNGLRRGWLALGLKLDAAPPERSVLGWEVRRSTRDSLLLGADSRIGMPAELLVTRHKRAVALRLSSNIGTQPRGLSGPPSSQRTDGSCQVSSCEPRHWIGEHERDRQAGLVLDGWEDLIILGSIQERGENGCALAARETIVSADRATSAHDSSAVG
jgi:hypothetical protein